MLNCNSYVAIIGDIINSREIANRSEVQRELKRVLDVINEKYTDDLASRFMITLGDEFQGLLKCGQRVMNIISEIELSLYPVKLRFGIGVGDITTDIFFELPLGADGPAYYNARNAIEKLKNAEKKTKSISSNIMILSDSSSIDALLNTILSLITTLKSKWTSRQREIIKLCFECGDNQTQLAEKLEVRQVTIQKALAASSYYTYKNSVKTISDIFAEIKVDRNV